MVAMVKGGGGGVTAARGGLVTRATRVPCRIGGRCRGDEGVAAAPLGGRRMNLAPEGKRQLRADKHLARLKISTSSRSLFAAALMQRLRCSLGFPCVCVCCFFYAVGSSCADRKSCYRASKSGWFMYIYVCVFAISFFFFFFTWALITI